MDYEYSAKIRPVLDCYDKIREILRNKEEIEIPKIVVVGDQSSGKSSVLESISNISLPRGQNTVTRCPIIIQMRSLNENEQETARIRVDGQDNEKWIELSNISDEIFKAQNDLINKEGVEITDTPIHIYLQKRNCPDLTLYDLPGLTYKEENLCQKIKQMIDKYTKGKETLVLIILPATSDLTTSEAIMLCKKNEDFQDRTIPVITKIDLVYNEKNLYSKIMNNELNLKFDPVVVRNRSQDELERNESIESIRKKEKDLIKSNDELRKLPENSKGIDQLIKTLISIQKEKLIYCKYEIKDKIYDRINKLREDEYNLPPPVDTLSDKVEVFKSCLNILRNRLNSLSSEFLLNEDKIKNIPTRIREQFEKSQNNFEAIDKKFFTDSFYDTISEIIRESLGLKLANFPDTQIFSKIIKEEIIQSTKNYNALVEDIKDYLLNISHEECKNAFSNYQNLSKIIETELKILMNNAKDGANKLIKELIDIESNIQFTLNPYYMDIISKIINKIKEKKKTLENLNQLSILMILI